MREGLARVRSEFKTEFTQLRSEVVQVRSEVSRVHGELGQVHGEVSGLRTEVGLLREDMQERESRFRTEMIEREARTLKAIETAAREIMPAIKLADSSGRSPSFPSALS